MQVFCPHCQNLFDSAQNAAGEILCPTCGSSFCIDQERTRTQVVEHRKLGKFELIDQVGSGAFGAVWRARDTELDRLVAIKIPHAGHLASEKEAQRFVREARSAAQLRHPGIVTVYEVGRHENLPYLVADFIQGVTLSDLQTARRLTFREAAELVALVAEALDYAHSMGVVHRDVKPSNIILERPSARVEGENGAALPPGRPLLMDFGLARRDEAEATMTQEGDVLGTPAYMSPEQAGGHSHRVDARSDVYSLGVVLYQLLTGELPFHGNIRMLLDQVLREEPRPPRRLNDQVPRDLETVCLKAITKAPASRYSTARAFADDLRRYLAGEPIQARPVYFWERTWRWARRRPAAAALVGVSGVALLTLFGMAVALTFYSRTKAAYAEAARQRATAESAFLSEQSARSEADRQRGIAEVALAGERRFHYYNRVIFADRELKENNSYRAEVLLDECPAEQRHWEWHYLKRQCHPERLSFRAHEGKSWSISYSPDGRLLATGGMDGTVRLWDAATGRNIQTFSGYGSGVCSVAFSPDGRRLASVCGSINQSSGVLIHEVASGRMLIKIPVRAYGSAKVVFHPSGRAVAISSGNTRSDGWVQVRDATTGRDLLTIPVPGEEVYSVDYRPDGKELVGVIGNFETVDPNRTPCQVVVWDADTGRVRLRLREFKKPEMFAIFDPTGRKVITGGYACNLRVWDAASGQELLTLRGHGNCVNYAVFSPDGRRIASASDDGSARVWDAETGEESILLRGHRGPFLGVAFSPDGRTIASTGNDGLVKLWDSNSDPAVRTLAAHPPSVSSLVFSPDGHHLVSGGADHMLKVWDIHSGRLVATLDGHTEPVWRVAFSPDGRTLASAAGDWKRSDRLGEVKVWDVAAGHAIHTLRAHKGIAWCVAFSPDGRKLASGGGEYYTAGQEVIIWDVATGRQLRLFTGLNAGVAHAAFHPDGRRLAAAIGRDIQAWNVETGHRLASYQGHTAVVKSVAFSPDGRSMISSSNDLTIRIWNSETGETISTLHGHKDWVSGIAISPDGRRIVSASADQTVKIWDAETGQELVTLRSKGGRLSSVAFSPDGRTIAAADEDGKILLWDGTPLGNSSTRTR